MKNQMVKRVVAAATMFLIISCNSTKDQPAAVVIDKEQIIKEIQAKEDEFASIYNTGEMKNIGYYADDATSFFQNRAPIVGKEAIISFLVSDIISNSDSISFKTNEVFVSGDGKHVLEIGYFKVVDSTNTAINTGNYMSLFEKRNGKYVCVRDMSTSDMPIKK